MATTGVSVTPGAGDSVRMRLDADGDGHGKVQVIDTAPMVETPVAGAQGAVAVSSTVVKSGSGLTIPASATHCFLSVEGNPIRFWNTGDVPTQTSGHLLANGAGPVELTNLTNLQLIDTTAGAATIHISYHKYV